MSSLSGQKRTSSDVNLASAGSSKRSAGPTVAGLQKELLHERERQERLQESVEQLRLELQMMGRLLAAAREQLIASGATAVDPTLIVRTPPVPATTGQRAGRSKSDARLLQRLQDELAESRSQCRRLSQQMEQQQQKVVMASAAKRDLLRIMGEMGDYLNSS